MAGRKQQGQIGLIILLIMVVLLTLGISIASRSSTDVKLSRQEEEASRVFDAAEAGIEQALGDIGAGTYAGGEITTIPNINVAYTVQELTRLETRVVQGHAAQVDVTGAANGNRMTVQWAKGEDCDSNAASVMVAIYNVSGGNYTVRREAYQGCDHSDNFTTAAVLDGDGDYFKKVSFNLSNGDTFVRIMSVYNDTDVQVVGAGAYTLPVQYYLVRSQAASQVGGETKAVEVTRTKPVAPSIFDYVLFSGTTLVK